jgi:hypothetical protein
VLLDLERDGASDRALREGLKVIEPGDKILVKLAEDLGIQLEYDGLVLTPEQRLALARKCLAREEILLDMTDDLGIPFEYNGSELSHQTLFNKCLAMLGYDFGTASYKIREEAKEPSYGEMMKEEIEALGNQFDYDGSHLPPEQRQALFKTLFKSY